MKKILITLIAVFLFAFPINDDILLIEAKLYPKILYLVDDFDKKNVIKIAILVNENSLEIGKKLKNLMKSENLKIDLIKNVSLNYDAYILTYNLDKKFIIKLLKNKKVLFSIYPNKLDNAIFSIYIGERVYPLVNPKLLKLSKLKFSPILLKVGKIYEK